MPPTDSSTEDTLDLRLSPQILALFAATPLGPDDGPSEADSSEASPSEADPSGGAPSDSSGSDSGASDGSASDGSDSSGGPSSGGGGPAGSQAYPLRAPRATRSARAGQADLLDHIGDWPPADTTVGTFRLVPVQLERDLAVVASWMNDPAVAEFWELAGDPGVTERHLRPQLTGDGRSVPCLGVLDGTPMSYWEIYRADLDPLARYYPARPHDTGVHLLIGGVDDRARGLGSTLLRAVATMVLDNRPACTRVVAEPDLRNTPSVSAFLTAGFRLCAEVDLAGKRAALMIRDRALRHLL
ncbi:MAG: hypothetical protein QOF98_1907 [Streptomyces sp.]|nr:hypothetical protein [Streptomyces sp.]